MAKKSILFSGEVKGNTLLPDPELLTITEVSQIFRVDPTTVRRWVKQGALEAIILPHPGSRQAYRIRRKTIVATLGEEGEQQRTAQLV